MKLQYLQPMTPCDGKVSREKLRRECQVNVNLGRLTHNSHVSSQNIDPSLLDCLDLYHDC